jgi:hypothetical protein
MLGYVGLDALISELEALSLELYNDRKSYRLDEVRTALERAFGEATVLLFDRIKNELVGGVRIEGHSHVQASLCASVRDLFRGLVSYSPWPVMPLCITTS